MNACRPIEAGPCPPRRLPGMVPREPHASGKPKRRRTRKPSTGREAMKSAAAAIVMLCVALTMLPHGAPAADSAWGGPPVAHRDALIEQRFGQTLADPYRWMENPDNGALYEWLRAEENVHECANRRLLARSAYGGVQGNLHSLSGGPCEQYGKPPGAHVPKASVQTSEGKQRKRGRSAVPRHQSATNW